jgi:hypothetical protein
MRDRLNCPHFSTSRQIGRVRRTQLKQMRMIQMISLLDLVNPIARACGVYAQKPWVSGSTGQTIALFRGYERMRLSAHISRHLAIPQKGLQEAAKSASRLETLQNLRAISMNPNEENGTAILHQGIRTLSRRARSLQLFRSCRLARAANATGEIWKGSHGSVRASQSLRRMRLSLVPRADPDNGLLQTMRS